MTPGEWILVIGGAVGLALAVFGVRMLVTRRAPAAAMRSFRSVTDAGCYHLLFGVALMLVVASTAFSGSSFALMGTLVALALVAVAVVRFRPRGRRSADND